MKAPELTPIPIPPAQRLRHARVTYIPWTVIVTAIIAIAILWKERLVSPSIVGQADGTIANVSSHQAGVLAGLRATRFQKVRAGEQIASVITADPKLVESSLAVIRAEIDVLRANMAPIVAQQRNAVDYAQLRLDWMRQRVALAVARANLPAAEAEFRRAEELFKEKIGSQSELDIARAAKQALEKEIEELTKLVAEGEGSFATMHPTNTADMASISDEPLRAAFAVQEAKLRQTEAELSPIKIVAPMDGTIIAVHFRSGESVTPGRPIVTIAADTPTRIIGYLRQPAVIEPRPGSTVTVRTRGIRRLTGTARVIEVGSQLDTMPQVLQSPVKLAGVELALPVDITVPANLKLRPGELVDITFTP